MEKEKKLRVGSWELEGRKEGRTGGKEGEAENHWAVARESIMKERKKAYWRRERRREREASSRFACWTRWLNRVMELRVMSEANNYSERRVPFADFSSVDEDEVISLESVLQWDNTVVSTAILHKN